MKLCVSKLRYKALIVVVSMLFMSSAFAFTYDVPSDYRGPFCDPIRDALTAGMLLDANRPLCERRFQLSPRAKRYGLSPIKEALLPRSRYADVLREILPVARHEHLPQSNADRMHDEAIIKRLLKGRNLKIYLAYFDADNSGKNSTVYIEDYALCDDPDSSSETNPSIFIRRGNGTFAPGWDGRYANGSPFTYKGQTYYARWQSLRGSVLKDTLAQLDIYESGPFDPANSHGASSAGLSPSYCKIYQNQ